MTHLFRSFALATVVCISAGSALGQVTEEKKASQAKATPISLVDGKLTMVAPKEWKTKTPKFRSMTPYEFSVPTDAKKGDPTARITFSIAGGSIDGNVKRWQGQFQKLEEVKSKVEKFDASEKTVHWVDLQGSFKDTMGAPPMMRVKPTIREGYRMLAAIIESTGGKKVFVKVVGPQDIVKGIEEPMKKMLKELVFKK